MKSSKVNRNRKGNLRVVPGLADPEVGDKSADRVLIRPGFQRCLLIWDSQPMTTAAFGAGRSPPPPLPTLTGFRTKSHACLIKSLLVRVIENRRIRQLLIERGDGDGKEHGNGSKLGGRIRVFLRATGHLIPSPPAPLPRSGVERCDRHFYAPLWSFGGGLVSRKARIVRIHAPIPAPDSLQSQQLLPNL